MTAPAGRRRRGRILFSLLLLLLLIGVVPLLYTSYSMYSSSRESLQTNQQEMQLDKARVLSQQVALYVQSLHAQVATIARTLEIDAGREPFSERVTRIRKEKALDVYLKESDRLVYVSVADSRTGRYAWSGLELKDRGVQDMLQEGFQRGQRGIGMISPFLVSSSLQEPVLVMEEPVAPGDNVEGVVLALVTLQPIRQMTKQSGERGLFEVYVVDNRGRLIAHSDPEKPLATNMSSIDIVAAFLESQGRMGVTIPFAIPAEGGARNMLGSYMAVPDSSGWGVIVQVEEDKAYYTAIQLRRRSIALVAVVAALAVILGSLFAGEISRPIRKLADGACF